MEHPTIKKIKDIVNLMVLAGIGKNEKSCKNHVANRLGFKNFEDMVLSIQGDPTILQKKAHKIGELHNRTSCLKRICRPIKNKKDRSNGINFS